MAMSKPSLMGSTTFKLRTTKTGAMKRSSLVNLDHALAKMDFTPRASTQQKIGWLRQILGECANWRAAKAHKLIPGPNLSANTVARAAVVDEVADQAMALLKYYMFEDQKANRPLHVPASAANRRDLQHGHQHERAVFADGKAAARRGLRHRPVPTGFDGGSLVEANMQTAGADPTAYPAFPPPVQAIFGANKPFDQLSRQEFDALAAFFGANNMSMQQPVHYARKDERVRNHMVVIVNGRLRKDPRQDYSCALDMWAMDKYGNFMCTAAGAQVDYGGGNNYQFNHSSLNAGHEVLCAGTVVITNGVIDEIDNNSGHYRPTRQNLHTAVNVLHHDLGATFAPNCVVKNWAPQRRHYNSLVQFLANPHAPGVAF